MFFHTFKCKTFDATERCSWKLQKIAKETGSNAICLLKGLWKSQRISEKRLNVAINELYLTFFEDLQNEWYVLSFSVFLYYITKVGICFVSSQGLSQKYVSLCSLVESRKSEYNKRECNWMYFVSFLFCSLYLLRLA